MIRSFKLASIVFFGMILQEKRGVSSDFWEEHSFDENSFFELKSQISPEGENLFESIFEIKVEETNIGYFTNQYIGENFNFTIQQGEDEIESSGGGEIIQQEDSSYLIAPDSDSDKEERLLEHNGKVEDKREPISKEILYQWPYRVTCHLKMIFKGDDKSYMGTGFLVGPAHVLTAGHNFRDWLTGKSNPSPPRDACSISAFFLHHWEKDQEPSLENLKGSSNCCNVWKVYFKKGYYRHRETNNDLALFILDKAIGLEFGWGGMMSLEPNSIQSRPQVEIHGYPRDSLKEGDCKCKGRMYGMRGPVLGYETDEDKKGKLYHGIDTTGGQSGSGIWFKKPSVNSILELGQPNHFAIGVHTGPASDNRNRGVLLQLEDIKYLSNTIKSHCIRKHLWDYFENKNGVVDQGKVNFFLEGLWNSFCKTSEQTPKIKFAKEFILYLLLFDMKIINAQSSILSIKNVNVAFFDIFKNAVSFIENEEELDLIGNEMRDVIFLLLMRKKIVGTENLDSKSGSFSGKTTKFLTVLKNVIKQEILRDGRLRPKNKGLLLDLSIDSSKSIVERILGIDCSQVNFFHLDNNLTAELSRFFVTMGMNFGFGKLSLNGHSVEKSNIGTFSKNDITW